MARGKDLAGLAALGALGYMLTRGNGETPQSTTDTGDETERLINRGGPRRKIEDYMAKAPAEPREAGIAAANDVRSTPAAPRVKSAAEADKGEDYGNEGSREATSRTYMTKTPGGDEKRTEGSKPMPSFRGIEARKASIDTDAMRNASRAQAAYMAKQKRMAASPESQALEESHPEQFLSPGMGVKTIAGAAKALANRGGREIAEYSTPRLAAPAKQLTGPSKADLVARDRAARAAARQEEMLQENASRYGLNPSAPGYEGAAGAVRKNLGGDEFTIMKKGGKVKKMASGGMTASRRADGIASRGKTKCKMY